MFYVLHVDDFIDDCGISLKRLMAEVPPRYVVGQGAKGWHPRVQKELGGLFSEAVRIPNPPTDPPLPPKELGSIDEAIMYVRALQRWASTMQVKDEHPPQGKADAPAKQDASGGMTWREAAKRMERLCAQGDPFTSQHKLAEQLGCSTYTINKAIHNTPALKAWAKRPTAAPRAQSINDVVTDRTAQSREPDPADEVTIREYLEREDLTPEDRALFNAKTREDQLAFLDLLDDPDAHGLDEQVRLRGRKP